jgi:hypothetical protein
MRAASAEAGDDGGVSPATDTSPIASRQVHSERQGSDGLSTRPRRTSQDRHVLPRRQARIAPARTASAIASCDT